MYCQINPKLFKEFTSRKKKIIPTLSDDWEILPESYNTKTDITYYSKKLNQKISGCDVFTLMELLKNYNARMEGLKLKGEWIIGQDRKLYSKEDYEKWFKKYGTMVEGKMSLRDITFEKRGKKYLFKCGAEYYFLGFLKDDKGKKVRLFGMHDENSNDSFSVITDGKKISKELDDYIPEEKMEKLITKFLFTTPYYAGEFEFVKFYDKDKGEVVKGFISSSNNSNRNFSFNAFDESGKPITDRDDFYMFAPDYFVTIEAKFENGFIYLRYLPNTKNVMVRMMMKTKPDVVEKKLKKYNVNVWKKYDKDLYFKRVKNPLK